ncbi:hypothetical protein CBL_08895 [Carabus blaptoides fortunei]
MEEDIDEVLLRLTNKSVMQEKSNVKHNLASTNNVLALDSESDDCCTSVSQRPVNPLSALGTSVSNSLPLPAVKMVTYERFWQGQAESLANDNKDDYTELSSSVGTFSAEPEKRHPVIFSEWCPILCDRKLQITGVTIDGSLDSRFIDRRISGYIFFDKSEVPCSLGGPMTLLNSQPKFIQHKFALGIPEDWVQVQSIWNSFEKLGSPDNFPWLSSTELDTSDPAMIGYGQYVIPSTKMAISTPRNNTIDFYNMTTDISKINASGGLRTYQQKLFHNTVNPSASRSMKKTYTSAALKKKMNKIRSMLKVTLMRECSKLTSFNELVELPENDLNVDNIVPQPQIIASDSNNEYLFQNRLTDQLVIKNRSKNNVNTPTTSQSKVNELAECANSLYNKVTVNNINADSLKTTTNVFLNKSQLLLKNKSCNVGKDISSSSKNGGKTKLQSAATNTTTLANVSQKCHKDVCQKDNLPSEMSELSVSANQPNKTNNSEQKLVKNSAGFEVSVNSKKSTPATSSSDYVPSNLIRKHRNSLTLLLNKIGIEYKPASDNSSEIDSLDCYPTNSDSVVISYHSINQIDVPSDANTEHTVKNNSFVVENVSQPLKNGITDNIHNDKVVQPEEQQLESSCDDSIFLNKSKTVENTNKEKFNAPIHETLVNTDNQYLMQTTEVISNQNSYEINKEMPANVDIPHHDKIQNNNVRNQKVLRNKILFSSESSDDDDDQNTNQINKEANTNVNLATKTIEEKINTSNSESSDDSSVKSILVDEIFVQSSNAKSKFCSESSDNSETQESHEIFVTNAVVHSAVKASVKSGQVSATFREHQNSNINKSDTRMHRKAIVEKSNEIYTNHNLEIISSVNDDTSANRSNNKIKSPEKRNRDNSSLKGKGKNTKDKKSHGEDEATNQSIMQEDGLIQFIEETIQKQNLPDPKQTPKSSKMRNNAKREKDTIHNRKSIATNLTLEFDLSVNNTTLSRKGRARCPTLPFWTGARFVTIGDESMITQISALDSSKKAVENKKRFLTPQKQTTVAKKARTKTPQKSPVKVLNTELKVLSPVTEQQNKNIANARMKTPKNTKNNASKNRKLNMPSHSSNDTKRINVVENNNTTRKSSSRKRSQSDRNKINEESVTEDLSSEICTVPIINERFLTLENQTSVAQRSRTQTSDKSPAKVCNTELVILSPAKTEQQNKNILAKTSKDIKTLHSRTKNTRGTFIDSVQRYPIRNSRSPSHSQSNDNNINENSVTESRTARKSTNEQQSVNKETVKLSRINHTSNVNLIELEVKTKKIKKIGKKHEVNEQDVTIKRLRSRGVSVEMMNNTPKSYGSSDITNLEPQKSVESSTNKSKLSKSPKFKSPKKITKTSKRETHKMVVPKLSPKESRKTPEKTPNKRQLRSDSVSLLSTKQNSIEQSIVINSNTAKRKTLKNNKKNTSDEAAISEASIKKSKKLKQNTRHDTNLTWNNADCRIKFKENGKT